VFYFYIYFRSLLSPRKAWNNRFNSPRAQVFEILRCKTFFLLTALFVQKLKQSF